MKYEHIGYNSKWAASLTQKDFLEHEKHQDLTVEQLKEVHRLCKAMHKKGESDSVEILNEGSSDE